MRYFIALFIVLLSLAYFPVVAQENTPDIPTKSNPKICVVLSGGGARGFAHIGVLKYLEEQHIPVHCIAGTSMGAVIGGLYASGMSANEIEQRLNEIKLGDVALDIVDRRKISQTLREDDINYPISGTFGLSKNGVTLPLGAVQANQFLELLHNWTAHLPPDIAFDQLPIPFRAVATDLETGEMVVFDKGPIHNAIRASMAAPGVFAPIEINGHLLSDGGLVRNLPVDIARSMGADVIIAVNIGTPLLPRQDLQSFFNISKQMVNILTEQNVNEQKKILLPTDVLIDPNLGDINFMDFPRAIEAVDIGYKAAQSMHDKLALLSVEPASYSAQLKARTIPDLHPITIAFVDVHSKGKIPPDDIRRQLNIPIGSIYNAEDINKRITPLINSRNFDSVVHSLVQRDGEYGVQIDATERSWGPNFVRVGLAMSTGFDGVSGFELQVGHRLPAITDSGLEWRNDLQFGYAYGIRSELRQPLIVREGMYVAPYINAQMKPLNLYSDNTRVAEYAMQTSQIGLDLGIPIGANASLGEIRTGFFASHTDLRPKLGGLVTEQSDGNTSITSLPWGKTDEFALHTRFTIDQLDTPVFPRDGYRLGGELIAGLNRTSSDSSTLDTHNDLRGFQQATVDSTWADSAEDHSINLSMQAGARYQSGSPIPGVGLSLGGFQRLTAYQPDQFIGNYLVYGNATYLFRAVNFGMAGEAAFVGTSLEVGNAGNFKSDFQLANLRKSLSVFVGANTFMGPVHFGIAIAPAGAFNLFLQLGRQ
ncbi:patatin-like phospholipase family protein [Solimicrobium silvestre]|uniref:Patatin-like phospholipase n=1 Tax=Solimicrobium silvestre TaxID=2099400 RepID=A0A2S9H2Q4_9BURK|nr:patatin-like phospholipase family protein [Solimicrobium silvestre]PRC94237.1 Patatin-like phospholipase [Solimicrobium silvestre]